MRRLIALAGAALALAASACLASPATDCASDLICSSDTVCDPTQRGCVLPEQLACAGQADESPCAYPQVPDGACFDGVCRPAGCGNGEIEEGEACDDGNRLHGDGCAADCRSNETCGNGVVDATVGEACDDGKHCQSVCDDGTPCAGDADCAGIGGETCTAGAGCDADADCAGVGDGLCKPREGDGCQANCASPTCGDGVIDLQFNEICDDGDQNSETTDADCRTNCQPRRCGDDVEDSGEVCDDGNVRDGDGCSADCLSDETCGNGVVDTAKGESCDFAEVGSELPCRSDCTVKTCGDGVVDLDFNEQCDDGAANSDAPDAACRTNCQPRRCGDGIPDTGEICDDGNVFANDGCAPNCLSDETCGNGVVDFLAGELCDDGFATLSADGCGGICLPETGFYAERTPALPDARKGHAVAYDAARGRLVMFGGFANGGELGDTWEWDGQSWTEIAPDGQIPAPRAHHAMAYDAARGRVLLFGGALSTGIDDDTWAWDGRSWTNLTDGANPPPRSGHAMAYDAARQRVVMFGGDSVFGQVGDTWLWDGDDWTRQLVPGPPARADHAMAFDPGSGQLVLFGGQSFGGPIVGNVSLADTWVWDGAAWAEARVSGPPARHGHVMAFDTKAGRVVLAGGQRRQGDGTVTIHGDTWALGAASRSWVEITSARSPPDPRTDAAAAFDIERNNLVLFGGSDGQPLLETLFDDTWTLAASTWFERSVDADQPTARVGAAMAYDSLRGRVVLFGGSDASALSDETWEWDGQRWSQVIPATGSPPARRGHDMVYDAAFERVIMFGGIDDSGNRSDTWEYDGSAWTELTPAQSPPARADHAMVYDSSRSQILLFGGVLTLPLSNPQLFDDTWIWDGQSWSPASPALHPIRRGGHGMAYDASRDRVVLFGGFTNGVNGLPVLLSDTHEWDGATWTSVTPPTGPGPRAGLELVYDATRRRTTLVDGATTGDTWEWDGAAWTELEITGPPARTQQALAYDAARGQSITFGGTDGTRLGDTWALRHQRPGDPGEACELGAFDYDNDGVLGCDDPDCWGRCTPLCPPDSTPDWPNDCDVALPHCGDGVCNPALETQRLCPSDCGRPPEICGDFICEGAEDNASCPGDCPI